MGDEGDAEQAGRRPGQPGVGGAARSDARRGRGADCGEGVRGELSRQPHHRGPLPVQAAAAVRTRRRGGRAHCGGGRRRCRPEARRPRHRLADLGRHGREGDGGCFALHADAGQHVVRRGQRPGPHLRHVDPRPQGPRQNQKGGDDAGAGSRGRRRALCGGARQGVRRPRHRRGLVAGEGGPRPEAWRRCGRGVPARPVRQSRRQGVGRPLQGRLRREGRRRDLRSCWRRLHRGGAPGHRVGGPLAGGRLPRRHPQAAAEPHPPQELPGRRRVLGRLRPAGSEGQRRQHRRADAALRQGCDPAAGLGALSARPCRRGDRAPCRPSGHGQDRRDHG